MNETSRYISRPVTELEVDRQKVRLDKINNVLGHERVYNLEFFCREVSDIDHDLEYLTAEQLGVDRVVDYNFTQVEGSFNISDTVKLPTRILDELGLEDLGLEDEEIVELDMDEVRQHAFQEAKDHLKKEYMEKMRARKKQPPKKKSILSTIFKGKEKRD